MINAIENSYWASMKIGIECGLRPLRAVGWLYEPEAVGDIGAYAPEGSRNRKEWGSANRKECGNLKQRESKAD